MEETTVYIIPDDTVKQKVTYEEFETRMAEREHGKLQSSEGKKFSSPNPGSLVRPTWR